MKWKSLSHVWLCNPNNYTVHAILRPRILEWVAFPFSRGSSQPRDQTQSPTLQVDSLPAEPQGKPKDTGVGSLSLLQLIFRTQESNQGLLHSRWILYQLSYQGSPRILEWVAYPFSKGSSQPRNQTGASCIAGRFFTSWATRILLGYKKECIWVSSNEVEKPTACYTEWSQKEKNIVY